MATNKAAGIARSLGVFFGAARLGSIHNGWDLGEQGKGYQDQGRDVLLIKTSELHDDARSAEWIQPAH
jgi:hypothetical protein